MVATLVLELANVTAKPEVEVAVKLKGGLLTFFVAKAAKLILCEAGVIFAVNPLGCISIYFEA